MTQVDPPCLAMSGKPIVDRRSHRRDIGMSCSSCWVAVGRNGCLEAARVTHPPLNVSWSAPYGTSFRHLRSRIESWQFGEVLMLLRTEAR